MNALLKAEKIKFIPPKENPESYYHILMIHQNRYNRSKKGTVTNSTDPSLFPSYINLIIWGHEHENIKFPKATSYSKTQYIYQAGSSVATSYSEAEGKEKRLGLFKVNGNKLVEFWPIDLKESKRTLIYKQIELANKIEKNGIWENKTMLKVFWKQKLRML